MTRCFDKSTKYWCSVASWEVEIYAWSTIWNFFWPHIASTASDKSFKFKDVFAQFFPNSDYLFFWFKIYMLGITVDWIPSRFFLFHFDYASFSYTFENWIFIFFTNFFHKCSKPVWKLCAAMMSWDRRWVKLVVY